MRGYEICAEAKQLTDGISMPTDPLTQSEAATLTHHYPTRPHKKNHNH